MNIKIRSEKSSDYIGVANVTYEAFLGWHPDNQYVSEPVLVDLLRHGSGYNPELSLVAEMDGKIAGHALFSPYKFIVQGNETKGAVLAPISVHPDYQRMGIGKKLIEEGHNRLKQLGHTFSLLCGHDSYYPRFGYKTRMFSEKGSKVSINAGQFNCDSYSLRPVSTRDLPWIIEKWHQCHSSDRLALFPGENISEWHNHGIGARCSVVVREKQSIGFVRYDNSSFCIKELLAEDEDVFDILTYFAHKKYGKPGGDLHTTISCEYLHTLSKGNRNIKITDQNAAYTAFMIKVLINGTLMEDYCAKVESGALKPGLIVFPPMFDIEDGRVE